MFTKFIHPSTLVRLRRGYPRTTVSPTKGSECSPDDPSADTSYQTIYCKVGEGGGGRGCKVWGGRWKVVTRWKDYLSFSISLCFFQDYLSFFHPFFSLSPSTTLSSLFTSIKHQLYITRKNWNKWWRLLSFFSLLFSLSLWLQIHFLLPIIILVYLFIYLFS